MTVLTNGRPVVTTRGSVLSAFVPKARPRTSTETPTIEASRPRRSLRELFAGRARQIKDGVVATAAFGCGTTAAFQWHPWAGWLSIGVSLLLIDHSIDRGGGDAE